MCEVREDKLITQYRDKMYIQRNEILNKYAKKTKEKGIMYYIYSNNSQNENKYNLCICDNQNTNMVIEEKKEEIPKDAKIGMVLRKKDDAFFIDIEATKEVKEEILKMQEQVKNEQIKYFNNKRIEGHIYEVSEIAKDRIWLFDITLNSEEAIEEIEISKELIKNTKEGDKYIYKNGEYKKICETNIKK